MHCSCQCRQCCFVYV